MATAYISHKVYNRGINTYFGPENDVPKVIGLFSEEGGAPASLLAVSGLKMGNNKNNPASVTEVCAVTGSFDNKVLTLNTIPYEATASLVTTEEGSNAKAVYFAVIDASANDGGDADDYTVIGNGIKNGAGDDATERGIAKPNFLTRATTISDLIGSDEGGSSNRVILYGKLSNTPIIDATTNFYFSGATINFTETIG
jgi:hypothetical protein